MVCLCVCREVKKEGRKDGRKEGMKGETRRIGSFFRSYLSCSS